MNGTYYKFGATDYIQANNGTVYPVCAPVGNIASGTYVSFTLAPGPCAANVQPLFMPTAGATAALDALSSLASADPDEAQRVLGLIISNLDAPSSSKPINKRAVMKAIR